jgi:hypothetical protein
VDGGHGVARPALLVAERDILPSPAQLNQERNQPGEQRGNHPGDDARNDVVPVYSWQDKLFSLVLGNLIGVALVILVGWIILSIVDRAGKGRAA